MPFQAGPPRGGPDPLPPARTTDVRRAAALITHSLRADPLGARVVLSEVRDGREAAALVHSLAAVGAYLARCAVGDDAEELLAAATLDIAAAEVRDP